MTGILALAAALVLTAGLAARRQVPPSPIPATLRREPVAGGARVVAQRSVPGVQMDVRVLVDPLEAQRLVEIELLRPPRAADLLLYYLPGPTRAPDAAVPGEAVLLGTVEGSAATRLALPAQAPPSGTLILYSAATRTTLATTSLPQAAPEMRR